MSTSEVCVHTMRLTQTSISYHLESLPPPFEAVRRLVPAQSPHPTGETPRGAGLTPAFVSKNSKARRAILCRDPTDLPSLSPPSSRRVGVRAGGNRLYGELIRKIMLPDISGPLRMRLAGGDHDTIHSLSDQFPPNHIIQCSAALGRCDWEFRRWENPP